MKTPTTLRWDVLERCRGVAAVEMGVILPFVVVVLMATFYLGRVYWHYNVVKNASSSAARYVAQGAWAEIADGTRRDAAEAMVKRTLTDAGLSNSVEVSFTCPPRVGCGGTVPASAITVEVAIGGNGSNFLFRYGNVWAVSTVSYPN